MGRFSVSVIVPNYNNEKYIQQCLDSVLAQTYPIKEIIVYDDCSTDGSRAILKEYANNHSNIQVILGEKNVGVSVARDMAIKATTSDYVCMLDADDFFFSTNKISAEMDTIEKKYNECKRKLISFSQTIDVDEDGQKIGNVKHVDLRGAERFRIVTRLYKNYMPRDYCFPRETYFECGGYTKGLSLYEDWELNIKFLEKTEFVYSSEYGTAYRHKEGGLSSVNYKKQLTTKVNIFRKYSSSVVEKLVFYSLAYLAFVGHMIKKRGDVEI